MLMGCRARSRGSDTDSGELQRQEVRESIQAAGPVKIFLRIGLASADHSAYIAPDASHIFQKFS